MARSRSFSGPLRRGQKRATSWDTIVVATTNVASNTAVLLASADADLKAKRPFTIVRTQLELYVTSDQTAASENQQLAVGMCVVSDQASAIGVSAIPTPDTDAGSDLWFLHQWMFSSFVFGTGVGFIEGEGRTVHVDSKAMRKVNDDEDVLVVCEASGNSSGLIVVHGGRILIKEH